MIRENNTLLYRTIMNNFKGGFNYDKLNDKNTGVFRSV